MALGALLALTGNLAVAQSSEAPPPPPGHWGHGPADPAAMAAHLAKRLNLSSEQQSQVEALLTNQEAQRKSLESNQTITHQQFIAQTKALHEETETKIQALLTDSQKQQYAEMKARRGPGPRPDAEGAPPPPQ
jgi:Spy/CpxP family protein refolding chaperone